MKARSNLFELDTKMQFKPVGIEKLIKIGDYPVKDLEKTTYLKLIKISMSNNKLNNVLNAFSSPKTEHF